MEKCEGIVIRQTSYRESDKIVRMYTREFGKIGVVARGAKKTKSRLAAVTQLFTNGYFTFFRGKWAWNASTRGSYRKFFFYSTRYFYDSLCYVCLRIIR